MPYDIVTHAAAAGFWEATNSKETRKARRLSDARMMCQRADDMT